MLYAHLITIMLQPPGELQTEICSYLQFADLLTLSRTNKSLAAAAKPFLFETLTFHGDAEPAKQYLELPPVYRWSNPGTLKPIEVAFLDIAIDEVLELDIVGYTKTFQYSPRVYDDGGESRVHDASEGLTVECRLLAEVSRVG